MKKPETWIDPIVEEVLKVRNEHAKKFNFDLEAIAADLKKQQKAGQRKFVRLPPKKPTVLPKTKIKKDKQNGLGRAVRDRFHFMN